MIKWIIIIGAFALFDIISIISNFPAEYLYAMPLLTLMATLAMLYRVYNKTRQGEREKLERELSLLKAKIEEDEPSVEQSDK